MRVTSIWLNSRIEFQDKVIQSEIYVEYNFSYLTTTGVKRIRLPVEAKEQILKGLFLKKQVVKYSQNHDFKDIFKLSKIFLSFQSPF